MLHCKAKCGVDYPLLKTSIKVKYNTFSVDLKFEQIVGIFLKERKICRSENTKRG
jgi:hypothetical protein